MRSKAHRLGSAILLVACASGLQAATVGVEHGVRLVQEDHRLPSGTVVRTGIGRIEVDTVRLRQRTGLAAGYLNMATSQGWVVRNLPVMAPEVLPYSKVTSRFTLGVGSGTTVASLPAAIDYGAAPLTAYAGSPVAQAVRQRTTTQSGGGGPTTAPPAPPDLTGISFDPTGANDVVVQFDHPNIEAANNQCVPMSVANSLQFLKNTTGLSLPHAHKAGLRESAEPGDDSLVGKIETAMNRTVIDRDNGEYTLFADGLAGKLRYLAGNGLASRVAVTHWGSISTSDVSVSVGGTAMRSTFRGRSINFDQVMEAMREGQNCEVDYVWPDGGHAVDLVAIGKTRGRPWIMHSSDVDQASDEEGGGPAGSVFEYLGTPDANGNVALSGSTRRAVMVICEKVLPEPAAVIVDERIDPAGHACCTQPPPGGMTVSRSGDRLTFNGAASWLPMTGTIGADGRYTVESSTTVAGFPNVRTRFTGTLSAGVYSGTISIGASGELPQGQPISYRVRVAEPAVATQPAMRVNGHRQSVAIPGGEMIQMSISMRAGALAGRRGDWWLAAYAGGQWYSYDLASASWRPGLAATYTGPLVDIPYFALPAVDGLPPGIYDLYFGFDDVGNGTLDPSVVYEKTSLVVRP